VGIREKTTTTTLYFEYVSPFHFFYGFTSLTQRETQKSYEDKIISGTLKPKPQRRQINPSTWKCERTTFQAKQVDRRAGLRGGM